MKTVRILLALALCVSATGLASAHTPYLLPTTFEPDSDAVTVTTALTNGRFFVPEFPIRATTSR